MEMMTAEQAVEAARGLTFEKVWAAMMEDRRRREEDQRDWEKRREEDRRDWEKRREADRRDWEKQMSDLSKNLGGIGNSLGDLTESMFINRLWEKFSEIGIPVTRQNERVKFGDRNKRVLAEVDLFIENGECAIAVEIKTKMEIEFVKDHLQRIEIVRRYLDERGDKRKILGAIAGGIVPKNVMNYAQKQGLYVVVQNGESVSIADAPQGFKAREW